MPIFLDRTKTRGSDETTTAKQMTASHLRLRPLSQDTIKALHQNIKETFTQLRLRKMRKAFGEKQMEPVPERITTKNWRTKIWEFLKKSTHPQAAKTLHQCNKTYSPSPNDVKEWAESLDKLMSNKYGMITFRLFMKSEFCEENIEFWLACEEYRKIKSSAKRVSKAKSIYKEFIKIESPKEINLDFHTKEAILQSLQSPTQLSFIAAQNRIYSMIENNSYPRFLDSQLYSQLYQLAHGTCTETDPLE